MNRVNRAFLRSLKSRLRLIQSNLADNQKTEKLFEKSIKPLLRKIENDRAKAYGDERKYLLAELAKVQQQIKDFQTRQEEKQNENSSNN